MLITTIRTIRGVLKYWHLTHHRLILPKNSSCPEVIQKCRLCTIFETPVPLKLYVNKKDEIAVIKSHWSQEEIIERSRANPDEVYLKEIMARLELLGGRNGKIPAGRTLTINGKLKVCKRVRGDDGGLPMSAYKFDGLFDCDRESIANKIMEAKRIEEEKSDIQRSEEGGIFLVQSIDYSGSVTGNYLERMIKGFTDEINGLGTGIWVSKASLIRKIESETSSQTAITNATWNAHADRKRIKVSSENHPGLLFRFNSNTWYVRYNEL
jgi:hypothetical protein